MKSQISLWLGVGEGRLLSFLLLKFDFWIHVLYHGDLVPYNGCWFKISAASWGTTVPQLHGVLSPFWDLDYIFKVPLLCSIIIGYNRVSRPIIMCLMSHFLCPKWSLCSRHFAIWDSHHGTFVTPWALWCVGLGSGGGNVKWYMWILIMIATFSKPEKNKEDIKQEITSKSWA